MNLQDECLIELQLALREAEMIQDLNMYQLISEKDDDSIVATQFDNAGHANAGIEHIKAAINAVLKSISEMLARISNFIHKAGMNNQDKELFKAYEEACKKDPNFKNKIIKVKDFKEQRKAYEKVLGQVNNVDKRLANGQLVDMNQMINGWSNTIGDAAKATVKSVTMEYAMNMAKSNMNYAKLIESQLNDDSKIMQSIRDSLGDKEASKFKKNIHTYTNRCAGRRFALKLRGKLFNNAEDCAMDIFNGVKAAINEDYPKLLNSSATSAGLRAFKGNENVRKVADEAFKIRKGIKKGQFNAAVHNATKPVRAVGDSTSNIDRKIRRSMGDYSDAKLFDILDGDGMINRQIQHTSKNVSKLKNKISDNINRKRY